MHNKRTIHRWGRVLSWFALTRLRWLESAVRVVSGLVIYLGLFPLILLELFVDISFNQSSKNDSERGVYPASSLLEYFVLSLAGRSAGVITWHVFMVTRFVRFAVYAFIASLMMLPIWLSFGVGKVSWMSVFKLMAIDHTSLKREQRSAYTRFAKIVLTHQIEGHRLSDWERLFIDGELSKLQKLLYGKEGFSTDDSFIKDGPKSALVLIEGAYARLQEDGSAAPYRTSGVRIPTVFDDSEEGSDDLASVRDCKVKKVG